ncbi:MAG: Tn3 family transposase [Desulforhopalus sp.]
MSRLKILNKNDIKAFDSPPGFSGEDRKRFFYLPQWASEFVETFRTPTNKIGFVLQLGYFKATNRFFISRKYLQNDIEFIVRKLQLQVEQVHIENYTDATFIRHKKIILEKLGYQPFHEKGKVLLQDEAISLCSRQTKPRLMFMSLVEFLREKKIEVPNYHTFSEIITDSLRNYEKIILASIEKNLSTEEKKILDSLLEFGDEYQDGEKKDSKIKRYKITLLKKSNQSTRPTKIKENIQDLQCLESLFQEIEPVIKKLNLSSELIQYYAQSVIKSQVFQTSRRENRKYLLLIAFVAHQYYRLNDVLIEVLMQSVQSKLNTIEREHKENFYNLRQERQKILATFSQKVTNHLSTIKDAKSILDNQILSADEKVGNLMALFSEEFEKSSTTIENQLNRIGQESKRITKNTDYYDLLEANSIKLQNRASEIVKNLQFNHNTSNNKLTQAIEHYRQKDGNLGHNAPTDFLDADEQELVVADEGKLKISLYKVLLFSKVADGIRSGALNLKYSYKYKAFDDYLISPKVWDARKGELLEKAGLLEMKDFSYFEALLRETLQDQFRITNENINQGNNKYATIGKNRELKVKTPKQEKELPETEIDLFPKNRFISLFEVLATVNRACRFTDCFEHWQVKHNRDKPANKTFFAGAIGYGCNLGIRRTAKISKNINQNELENTINWYFSYDNTLRANDKILAFLDRLQLLRLFKQNQNITHTSSDGQKFTIGVESLNANSSFKYFGKGKGVSVYSFIDESHRLSFSTVINPAEREAAYVIDGLMHNDVVQSDIHSTDTHGYSEMIFAVTHLLGISFAPRIKKFKDQQLYSFESPAALKACGYKVLPKKKINTKIIQEQWDNILRFIATIKLKETTASQLFKRLSSYSRQHPLYRALKQFGRIIKTIFLLKYIDDVELRQMIEKQLNKLESSNKFGKAVFYGRNQEFQYSTKEEQLIADGCKRLIENAIICWNYMYLSQRMHDTISERERNNLIHAIKNGSVVAWQHINLQGEFDFSEEVLKDSIEFKLPEILELQV